MIKVTTQISRVLVGILFIISGLIKANDTLGFSYKLIEYFELFGWDLFIPFAVPAAMAICIFEIISGVALLIGIYVTLNAWLLLILIAFFTWLTGYSAITHKVTDCGCFGDALKLTPLQSFLKDVVLFVLIVLIVIGKKNIQPLFNKVINHIGLFVAFLVTLFFTLYTYMFLPVKDFLPYKIGNNIKELTTVPENAPKDIIEMLFIYEKEGKTYEFSATSLPTDIENYNYIDRKDKLIQEGYRAPIHDFKLFDSSDVELTEQFFSDTGYKLLLVQTKLNEELRQLVDPINALYDYIKESKTGSFWALTASSKDDIKAYSAEFKNHYTFYNMDAIPLKSMVRSNPGLILLKNNVVVKKWGAFNFPDPTILKKYIHQ
jgi:uncharacterized membrane protein YphA (DoxX/SURF4 family)